MGLCAQDVRVAAIQALPLAPDTLPVLLDNLRDPSSHVRTLPWGWAGGGWGS